MRDMFLKNVSRIFLTQCQSYFVIKAKKVVHVYGIYAGLRGSSSSLNSWYSFLIRHVRRRLVESSSSWSKQFPNLRIKHTGLLISAAAFSWNENGVSDSEIKESVNEFWRTSKSSPKVVTGKTNNVHGENTASTLTNEGWEPILVKEKYQVWRKWTDKGLYQYKMFGTYKDIPAKAFFLAGCDTHYRKEWDKLVIQLDIVDKERKERGPIPEVDDSGNEIIYWAMHYPFPMYGRDYCYVRRAVIDRKNNMLIYVSRAVDHPNCPPCTDFVRVEDYKSEMVIRPHKTFDDNGFDYLLTYFDDPRSAFPRPAYNWMACSGVPDFIEKLYKAAFDLHCGKFSKSDSKGSSNVPQNSPASNNKTRDWAYA